MKQSLARIFITLSLILSLTSFILSLIALHLPNWKNVQLRSTFTPAVFSDNRPMDPLIRGEVDKFIDTLYRRGETHSLGLSTHCIVNEQCGQNLLLSFDDKNYGLCHSINHHRQCIFSNVLSTPHESKCSCQSPSYVQIIHTLLIGLLILQLCFFLINALRLVRHQCNTFCLNDSLLRLTALLASLCSFLFLIVIIIQSNTNRLVEPLDFFEAMRQHYSRIQIYTFTKDLDLIIRQIEQSLDVHLGASYICIVIVSVLTFVSFFASVTVEIKISSTSSSLTISEDDEKKLDHTLIPPTPAERFVPSEQIRFVRQTIV